MNSIFAYCFQLPVTCQEVICTYRLNLNGLFVDPYQLNYPKTWREPGVKQKTPTQLNV